jgi:isopenicillin-N N-acyltransferase-like protein
VLKHDERVVESMDWLVDTRFRHERIGEVMNGAKEEEVSGELVERLLKDEVEGDGASICRRRGKDGIATLFSIVMDLEKKRARVLMGRPVSPSERVVLNP